MPETPQEKMIREVGARQRRMMRARKEKPAGWSAFSMLGVIGWSVVIPTLVGIALGAWIDHRWPGRFSWTVILLVAGLAAGCVSAWLRIREEQ